MASLYHLVTKILKKPSVTWLLLIFLLLSQLFIFKKIKVLDLLSGQNPMLDFDSYYYIVQAVFKGQHPYQVSTMQTMGPPTVIIPFLPFGLFSLEWGRIIMTILNLVSSFIACFLLAKQITKKPLLLTTLVFSNLLWFSFPARFSLALGQPNLVMMLLITLLITNTNEKIKSLSFGLLILFKTFFVFPLLTLIPKQNRLLFLTLAVIGGLMLLSLQLIKPQYYYDFMTQRLIPTTISTQQIKDVDYYNQSLKTTFARFNLSNYYSVSYILLVLISLGYLLLSKNFYAGIVISVILSPVIWQHYFVYLFPIFIFMAGKLFKTKRYLELLVVLIGLSLMLPEFSWLQRQPATLFNSLVASHYLASALLLLFICISQKTQTEKN